MVLRFVKNFHSSHTPLLCDVVILWPFSFLCRLQRAAVSSHGFVHEYLKCFSHLRPKKFRTSSFKKFMSHALDPTQMGYITQFAFNNFNAMFGLPDDAFKRVRVPYSPIASSSDVV